MAFTDAEGVAIAEQSRRSDAWNELRKAAHHYAQLAGKQELVGALLDILRDINDDDGELSD